MNSVVVFKRTRSQYRAFVKQFIRRLVEIHFKPGMVAGMVLCPWCCCSVISHLYRFFSTTDGVVNVLWFDVLLTSVMALIFAPSLILVVILALRCKRVYKRMMYEACPFHGDEEIDAEVRIDEEGVSPCKGMQGPMRLLKWEEMVFASATKEFYIFMDKGGVVLGIPKNAVNAKLNECLMSKMRSNKQNQLWFRRNRA